MSVLVLSQQAPRDIAVSDATGRVHALSADGALELAEGRWSIEAGGASLVHDGAVSVRTAASGERRVVLRVDLEEYVARVVASESLPDTPPEALKALAVVVRSFALASERHGDADVCDLAHCQVFRASLSDRRLDDARAAASATAGIALRLHGEKRGVAEAPFHSACGGHTADPREVFGGSTTGAAPAIDAMCPAETWPATLSADEMSSALDSLFGRERRASFDDLVLLRGSGGWIVQARLASDPSAAVSGDAFARALDREKKWGVVRSGRFDLRRTPAGFVATGSGHGHGVGLCQTGAAARARSGEGWRDILRHYFPDATPHPR